METDEGIVLPDKLYFRIGEVSTLLGVRPHVLRYWESEFRAIRPQKSRSNHRLYRQRDIQLLAHLKHLLYEEGFTLAGARKQLQARRQAPQEPTAPPEQKPLQSPQPARIRDSASAPDPEAGPASNDELKRLEARCGQLQQALSREQDRRKRLQRNLKKELESLRAWVENAMKSDDGA